MARAAPARLCWTPVEDSPCTTNSTVGLCLLHRLRQLLQAVPLPRRRLQVDHLRLVPLREVDHSCAPDACDIPVHGVDCPIHEGEIESMGGVKDGGERGQDVTVNEGRSSVEPTRKGRMLLVCMRPCLSPAKQPCCMAHGHNTA